MFEICLLHLQIISSLHIYILLMGLVLLFMTFFSQQRLNQKDENHFRLVFDHSPSGMALVGLDGEFLKVNPALTRMLGYTEEELLERTFQEVTHPDDLNKCESKFAQILSGQKEVMEVEKRYLHKEGNIIWAHLKVAAVTDKKKNPRYVISQLYDITDKHRAQAELKASKDKLQTIIRSIPDSVALLDRDGNILDANPASLPLAGVRKKEKLLEKEAFGFINAEYREEYQNLLDQAFEGKSGKLSFEITNLKGRSFWIEAHLMPFRNHQGEITKALVISRNITEQKRSEESLRASNEFLHNILDRETSAVYTLDLEGKFQFVNNRVSEITGYSNDELLDQHFEMLFEEESLSELKDIFYRISVKGEKITHYETAIIRKDGERRFLTFSSAPLYQEGEIVSIVGTAEDITEKRKAKAKLRENQERLRLIVQQLPAIVWTTDCNLVFTSSMGAGLSGLNLTTNEVVGMSLKEFFGTDDEEMPALQSHFKALEGKTSAYEFSWMENDYRVRVEPLRGDDGEIIGSIGIALDITRHKQIEEAFQESQRALSTLISNLPGMAYRCKNDEEWTMEYLSEGVREITGYSPEDFIGNQRISFADLYHKDDIDRVWSQVQKALKKRDPFHLVYRIFDIKGREKWIWEKGRGVFDEEGNLQALEGFLTDITDRKRIENLLSLQKQVLEMIARGSSFEEILHSLCEEVEELLYHVIPRSYRNRPSPHPTCIVLVAKKDEEQSQVLGGKNLSPDELKAISSAAPGKNFLTEEFPFEKKGIQVLNNISQKESPLFQILSSLGYNTLWSFPLQWESEGTRGAFIIFQNFASRPNDFVRELMKTAVHLIKIATDHRDQENQLKETNQLLKTLSNIQRKFITQTTSFHLEEELCEEAIQLTESQWGLLVEVHPSEEESPSQPPHPSQLKLWGKEERDREVLSPVMEYLKDLPQKPITSSGDKFDLPQFSHLLALPIYGGNRLVGVFLLARHKAYPSHLLDRLAPFVNTSGNLLQAHHNELRRRKAESAIKASLREKEILLKEIHHRVKNNLQIVSSLLNLQTQSIRDSKALTLFESSQQRIHTMALIHEKLYQSKDFSQIDFASYIRTLSNYLFRVFSVDPNRIHLELNSRNIYLQIHQAIPLALIISELVSNALKYAFPSGQKGKIEISLSYQQKGNLHLLVRDNGKGMENPEKQDFSSLGLKLVKTLINQLEGKYTICGEEGTRFDFYFPAAPAKSDS